MTYTIIQTGSSGNAVLINDSILIDCGVPYLKLETYTSKIRLVLLSHVHCDHFNPSTIKKLHTLRPGIRFACCEWMVEPLVKAGVSRRAIDVLTLGKLQSYIFYGGGNVPEQLLIQAEETPHNVRNCCYKLVLPSGEKLLYATDCGSLSGVRAEGYQCYFVESNHYEAEIESRIEAKRAAGEFSYEEAAAKNHLSYEKAAAWIAENAGPESVWIPMHQHVTKEKRNV